MNNITPTRDASPTDTNDVNTHSQPSTPNRFINVVSQSQGSGGIDALIEATVRTSNDEFSPMSQTQIRPMEVSAHLYDDNLNSQVPADAVVTLDPGVMPPTHSPVKRDLIVNFEMARKKRRGDGIALRQTNYEASRLSLRRAFPFDTLCTFLRDSIIDAKLESLRSTPIAMHNTMRSSLNSWQHQNIVDFPDIMVGIQSLLESSPHAIGPFGRRLFLEDYMMLEAGNEIVCYITPSHPDFKDSKGNQKLFLKTCSANPLRPMILGGQVYFGSRSSPN